MAEIVWIIDADNAHSIGGQGISKKYIIPGPQVTFAPEKLRDSTIWVVLRGSLGDRLFAVLNIEMVERFVDGYYKDDYLLWCRQDRSFRAINDYSEGEAYSLGEVFRSMTGLKVLEESAICQLRDVLKKNISLKLLPPEEKLFEKLGTIHKYGSVMKTAKACMALVASGLPLNQIWGSGGSSGLLPFSNFCYSMMKKHFGESSAQEVIGQLMEWNPLKLHARIDADKAASGKGEKSGYEALQGIAVDLDFSQIDPKMIYAREYVAGPEDILSSHDALLKTERAERFHQEILRDISQRLLGLGRIPMQSSSVDLLLCEHDKKTLFEIKTTNLANILSQVAKGLFQLATYKKAIMEQGGIVADQILIITRVQNAVIENHVKDVAAIMGVKCLVYDHSKGWPDRLEGVCW